MTEGESNEKKMLVIASSRFGDLSVPEDSIIELPSGLIGFPRHRRFVMLDHKPPFSWLQSLEDSNLAFVVVDGFQFGENYSVVPPYKDREIDLQEEDEFAILVIATVRPDPTLTTVNLKAPVFVNIRNRKGVQVIFDDPRYSTRFPLWTQQGEGEEQQGQSSEQLNQVGEKGESPGK
ncbi:MAG: flagellar assembly protein FliW [Proteobacteria bacterium]|nr:MAG: flagellar assembly protein FliW [Pseudomonadota bacterium]